jgi:pimeloyl-ACP methyl ester carboxylesterase
MFADQIDAFDALVIDGFYGSAARVEAMAEYALERMPGRCALLGHSMGARVALEIWRAAPERVERLALADTGVHSVEPGEAEKRYRLRDLGRAEGAEALVNAWLPPMIGGARRQDSAMFATLREMAIEAGTVTYERQVEALLHRPDTAGLLSTIDCPTFVIVGSDDLWSPVEQHEAIAAAIPGAELRIVDEAGHMAPAEDPQGFNEILREWLSWPSRRPLLGMPPIREH